MKRRVTVLLTAVFWLLVASSRALSAPSQEDVFRSIQDNLNEPSDPSKLMSIVFAVAGAVLLLVILSVRRQREVAPKTLNHHGKLVKEIARRINLKPAEVRQLKSLADEQSVSSPLTLLLCPSILNSAMKKNSRADKRLVSSVMRKIAA